MDVMAEKYLPYGYEYFVMDAGWYYEAELYPNSDYPKKRLGLALDEYGLYEPCKTVFPKWDQSTRRLCPQKRIEVRCMDYAGNSTSGCGTEPSRKRDTLFCQGYC